MGRLKMMLTTCHDGAQNMMKASKLPKSQSVQHCVTHALHLLITSDSLNKVAELHLLVQKCRDIVTTLHFKAWMLEEEDTSADDLKKLEEMRQKVTATQAVLDADSQFELSLEDENDDTCSVETADWQDQQDVPSISR